MLLFMIVMTFVSGGIEIWENVTGARYWPMVLLLIADVLFAVKTVGVVRKMKKEGTPFKVDLSVFKKKNTIRLLLAFGATIAYVALMTPLGFVISTFLYAMAMSWILGLTGWKNLWKLALVAFCITAVIYAIFVWGLGVMVPRGQGQLYYFGLFLETLWL